MPPREPSLGNSDTSSNSDEILQLLESINDQAVFYPGRQHGKHLDLLLHLSRYSNLLLTITGPTGSGKTHLKNKLREQLDSGVTAVNLDAGRVGKAPKLLSALESALRLDLPSNADNRLYLEEIRNHTQLLSEDGGSCLLLIDNAEELDQGALNLLLELATTSNDSRRPHLALFGRDELLKRLNDRDNQARFESVGHHLPLEAFGEVEARGYLEHRCRSVGLDHLPLNDNQFRQVFKASHGWPGLLNQALINELRESGPSADTATATKKPAKKPAAPKKKKNRKTPLWPIFGAAVLIAGLVVGFLYYGDFSDDTTVSPTATGLISRSQELRQGSVQGPLTESSQVLDELERQVEDLPPLEEEVAQDLSASEEAPVDTPDATPPAATDDAPFDSPDDAPPEMTDLSEPVFEPLPLQDAAPEAEEPEQEVSPEETDADGFSDAGHRREAWLMERPENNFTLQLLASSEEATVSAFINSQDNPEDFAYYRRDHAGSPWVVVYGDFANRDEAEAARNNLADNLQNLQPWLRRFGSIQSDLNNR